ncbi:hypothetical protein E2C01_021374 [Portunus trituberculatus]|uniref:Uncharacterized protein n=1 Tax=Portunus trituberculatus TaxID=210409 RepID=A0A5B7E429_PORTR|nr:hypothetical protein [Portunus trituberculatus]
MASVRDEKKVGKTVRKTSLEASIPKLSNEESMTLRRVRSDTMALVVPTFTTKFLTDDKDDSSKSKKVNLNIPGAMSYQAENTAKVQTKKPSSGRRRKSSAQQGIVLDVAALHKLKEKQESDDRISMCSSMQSVKSSQSPDLSPTNQNGEQARMSPSFHITYSLDTEDRASLGGSDASSVYHSSCMYPPEEGPVSFSNLLEDPRKSRNQYKRRMSSPIIQSLKQQQSQDANNTKPRVRTYPDEDRCHSSQGNANLSFELTGLPSKSKYYSTQEDLAATSIPDHPASVPIQRRDIPKPASREDLLTPPRKGFRGSIDSQTQENKRKDSNKELADQHCRSNFGIVLSVICFILFLWYLAMVSSKFIKSALSFQYFSKAPSVELGSVHEVIVYIIAENGTDGNT